MLLTSAVLLVLATAGLSTGAKDEFLSFPIVPHDCDLTHGSWVPSDGPLYTTCPPDFNHRTCRTFGRMDTEYENWRWKPSGGDRCDLPRFNPTVFLELMRNKTLAFVGDSLSRNMMDSLLCLLHEVEEPSLHQESEVNFKYFYFPSFHFAIQHIEDLFVMYSTQDPETKKNYVHIDIPHPQWFHRLPRTDVLVMNNGHWWGHSVHDSLLKGGKPYQSDKTHILIPTHPPLDHVLKGLLEATRNIFESVMGNEQFKGLMIYRSYSPNHFQGGSWNKGGSCSDFFAPFDPKNDSHYDWRKTNHYEAMVYDGVKAIAEEMGITQHKAPHIRYMDITHASMLRGDGHPGPYRFKPENGTRHKWIPKMYNNQGQLIEDCAHWCLPGPIDVWSELLLQYILRWYQEQGRLP